MLHVYCLSKFGSQELAVVASVTIALFCLAFKLGVGLRGVEVRTILFCHAGLVL